MIKLDVRTLQPRDRHHKIFKIFDALRPGDSFELVNDHAPKPLYSHFLHERPDLFEWEYQEEGPEVWRVKITRKANGGS
jgi:uncharacterized protein (DUF2249 family)